MKRIKFIVIMAFLMGFLEYAKAQSIKLDTVAGLIIHPYQSELPQDVIIIPMELKPNARLHEVVEAVLNNPVGACFTYFQNMRWINPNLNEEVQSWAFLEGEVIQPNFFTTEKVKYSYGRIIYDRRNTEAEQHRPEQSYPNTFVYNGKQYTFMVKDANWSLGIPKVFEKVDLPL